MLWLPVLAMVPAHAPEAVQEVALTDDQVSIELLPLVTVFGLADSVIVGAGAVTETVTDCEAVPPAPVQVKLYVALAFKAPVACVPLAAFAPDHAPLAVQEVALALDQLNAEPAPLATVLGDADRVTVGAAAVTDTVADCEALPPVPAHVMP